MNIVGLCLPHRLAVIRVSRYNKAAIYNMVSDYGAISYVSSYNTVSQEAPVRYCSHCGDPHDANHPYCGPCHRDYNRQYLRLNGESATQIPRRACRRLARYRRSTGRLVPQPCRDCGAISVEMHHSDYSKPFEVVWLCKPCHQRSTRQQQAVLRDRRLRLKAMYAELGPPRNARLPAKDGAVSRA